MSDRIIQPSPSWVILRKSDGTVICELFDIANVRKLHFEVYEAVPIRRHLQELNKPVATGEKPSAGGRPDS